MHKNLLNAEFTFVWCLSDKNESVQKIRVIKRLQRSGPDICREAFATRMPAVNCIFQFKKHYLASVK